MIRRASSLEINRLFCSAGYLAQAIQRLLASSGIVCRQPLLESDPYYGEAAGQALEKALIFTLDAYSHSGLVSDEEIIQKLQQALAHYKRKSISDPRPETGIEAYVLLNCDLGLEEEVSKALMAIPEVSEVKGVFGVYDFVVKIFTDSEDEIKNAIAKVRSIDKIKSSLTMMVIENQGRAAMGP